MATPVLSEKPRLVAAYAGFLAKEKTPAQNDPALAACLARIEQNCKNIGPRSNKTYNKLNNYAVARADGLWLLFNPQIETLRKECPSSMRPAGKFIAVDIPKGMWSMGEGRMMVGIAPVSMDIHADILTDLMYTIVSDRDAAPKGLSGAHGAAFFSLGNADVEIIGAGAIEYRYRLDGKMLEIFVDPVLSSTQFGPVPPDALSEIIERVNGCEGVRIERRCL
ncbi:MAG: hypothetical protein WC263_05100 [Candidatus Micrarchaeia archaeon]|jgi:hypothetical protein